MFTPRTLALAAAGLLALTAVHGGREPAEEAEDRHPAAAERGAGDAGEAAAGAGGAGGAGEGGLQGAGGERRLAGADQQGDRVPAGVQDGGVRVPDPRVPEDAETLAAKAKDKNLDGATLAYLDMTLSCVACHNHFRGKKRD